MCPNHRRVRRRIGLHVAPGARLSSEPDPDAHFCPHTGNQGGAIVPQFPLHEARCLPAQHEGGPTSASTLYTSLPAHLPRARTVTFQGAEDQGSRERASPACEFPLVSVFCSCPVLDQSVSLPPYTQTYTHTCSQMSLGSSIRETPMPSQVGGGGLSLFLQGTWHGANVPGQRVRAGSRGGHSAHHGTEITGNEGPFQCSRFENRLPWWLRW